MKKIVICVSFVLCGFIFPDIINISPNRDKWEVSDIDEERNRKREQFVNAPTRNNLEKIWGTLFYQGSSNKDKYDLFPYEWYMAFHNNDYTAKYTMHRMLLDTIYDQSHYIPNACMKEFAKKIRPTINKTANEAQKK